MLDTLQVTLLDSIKYSFGDLNRDCRFPARALHPLEVFPAKTGLLLPTHVKTLLPGTSVILLFLYLMLKRPRPLLLLLLIVL